MLRIINVFIPCAGARIRKTTGTSTCEKLILFFRFYIAIYKSDDCAKSTIDHN